MLKLFFNVSYENVAGFKMRISNESGLFEEKEDIENKAKKPRHWNILDFLLRVNLIRKIRLNNALDIKVENIDLAFNNLPKGFDTELLNIRNARLTFSLLNFKYLTPDPKICCVQVIYSAFLTICLDLWCAMDDQSCSLLLAPLPHSIPSIGQRFEDEY
jgi:hypothetical protein